jgi:hypothetical protein
MTSVRNDEARMTNDEGMTNDEIRNRQGTAVSDCRLRMTRFTWYFRTDSWRARLCDAVYARRALGARPPDSDFVNAGA